MNSEYVEEDKLLIIKIMEEIDHHTTEEIRRKVDYEIQRHMPKKAIFDFDSVTFMDSAGIGLLIGRYKVLMLLNGKMGLIHVAPSIKRILEISGILKIIPIYKNVEESILGVPNGAMLHRGLSLMEHWRVYEKFIRK